MSSSIGTSTIGRPSTETVEEQREQEARELDALRVSIARGLAESGAWTELGDLTSQGGRYRRDEDGNVYRLATPAMWNTAGWKLTREDAATRRLFKITDGGTVCFYALVAEAPETTEPAAPRRRRLSRKKATS